MDLNSILATLNREGLSMTPACKGLLQRELVEPLAILIVKGDRIGMPIRRTDYQRFVGLFVHELVSQARRRGASRVGVRDFDATLEVVPVEKVLGDG